MVIIYDIIVIGAGPSGSRAAALCAEAGLRTLLLEKRRLPREKPCGGATNASFVECIGHGCNKLVEAATERTRVFLNMNKVIEYRQMNIYFHRPALDEFLARLAEKSGAELLEDVRVCRVKTDPWGVTVASDKGAWSGRLIIGADGVNSTVRSSTGMDAYRSRHDRMLACCLEHEIDPAAILRGEDGKLCCDIHFFNGLMGLGWVFPKRSRVNIGIGHIEASASHLRSFFKRLLRSLGLPVDVSSRTRWHLIPYRPLKKLCGRRVLLVGDAAGFVNPFTGAGIDLAVGSAGWAASVTIEACRKADFSDHQLRRYQTLASETLRNLSLRARMLDVAAFFVEHKLDAELHDRFFLKRLAPLAST